MVLFPLSFFMYKKYSYIEKELVLLLKFKDREEEIVFNEPTLYNISKAEELVRKERFWSSLEVLWVKITPETLMNDPMWILKWLFELLYKGFGEKQSQDTSEDSFLPGILDLVSKRYGILPNILIKQVTPSQLSSIFAGIEYNMNIENGKKEENYKFKVKETISEFQQKKYDEIMKRVEKAKKKRKVFD